MCNLILLYKVIDNFPIIGLHSRYEAKNRPETPPRVLKYTHRVYAPVDVPSHGSWVGINEHQVFAAITNQYSTVKRNKIRSRGILLTEALGISTSADEALTYIQEELSKDLYKTANFVIADPKKAFHLIYDEKRTLRKLGAGTHVITTLTPLDEKKMNEKMKKILSRAKSRKKRSVTLLQGIEDTPLTGVIHRLKRISRDHKGGLSRRSICYHDPRGKMRQTSATIVVVGGETIDSSKIFYAPGNPCKHQYIDYAHLFQGESISDGEIRRKTGKLSGKEIAICVTGSVASIMTPKLARELRRYGAEVKGYMTKAAVEFGVSPDVMEWATGHSPVLTLSGAIEHLKDFDVVLVYPATYNTIGKLARGIADNAVMTLCGAIEKDKLLIVPAMNLKLWSSPILEENIQRLKKRGVTVINPVFAEGIAKIANIQEIVDQVVRKSQRTKLQGRQTLILTGPTRADIDPVRYISNKSTGRLGYHLTRESIQQGCKTTVIYGPGQVEMPKGADVLHVYSTKEMLETTLTELKEKTYEIVIFSAAVLDFKPEGTINKKIRSGQKLTLNLTPTPKIIEAVISKFPKLFTVGFKLDFDIERDELIDEGYNTLKKYNADIIVANDLTELHGSYHPAHLIDRHGLFKSIKASKQKLAEVLFKAIEARI
ncbi:MAG: bifunctional phosphopantothenoylcysteine decarboxylase/phosphopantothenate--cysteine ligase CoaBC [Candidatus Korarchaeota archaeon]|nr:bifunctional phosphopantothenoylcysteine decarboxylase/phosphopantothenate--cysteine ligase CoaBC [Candidatus Korarchaeota archaeon]NIU85392.1 bifunctional phosphopantothenoylcysteine decarboxylase/phosphopantothenate--cysteine ligase CoaBC [Candidatus Thorarchaeota archaeon]NIW15490.1 bifunctional phosphopantothenoylcysteine decarboxylase/phosphopantothenate--cysteine ligase CoaBC [Candidatus Thorarchaeota archaeon]NIW53434.1 bifunctional phosphopantothenoylcysteine decarboxylase/phosphopant